MPLSTGARSITFTSLRNSSVSGPNTGLAEMHQVLGPVATGRKPFDVELKSVGWFPNERSPRVLWVGVDGGDSLQTLAKQTDDALTPLGVAKEDRNYTPHLTLARIKHPVPLSKLRARIKEMEALDIGTFSVSQFAMFRSRPGTNSSIYEKMAEFPFESAMAAS